MILPNPSHPTTRRPAAVTPWLSKLAGKWPPEPPPLAQAGHLRDTRCCPLTFPIPAPPPPLWPDWKYVPETGEFDDAPATFGSSSVENMRNRLFYIEFEIKRCRFSGERFGISSVRKDLPWVQQEKHFAIVNLHRYSPGSFSYC